MSYRLLPVTAATLPSAPPVCVDCVFWQSRGARTPAKARWAERAEEEWGAWGTLYRDDGERLLGFVQYGPATLFPRAFQLPAGPPSEDAVLITCAYLVDPSSPWVMQSLFLSVIGEARDRKLRAIEAFGYRYPEASSVHERFLAHRTVFPSDFLADFGFVIVRAEGRVELARLELRGLVPVEERRLGRAWRVARELLAPQPVPERY
ncbi:MAG: hypothetical protein KJ051_07240 [Thermoleophilia bacterium]|nr:hypothetical protein [Thermoleophilia bacterium]